MKLYTKILIGMILGTLAGAILHYFGLAYIAKYTDYIGKIFIRLIKMVVVPLILASLILGAANLGDIKKIGKIGIRALTFFMLTTFASVTIGITLANALEPGVGLPAEKRDQLVAQYKKAADKKLGAREGRNELGEAMLTVLINNEPIQERKEPLETVRDNYNKKFEDAAKKKREKSEIQKILDILLLMVPVNPVEALAKGDMLAIIFFALFFGLCITLIPEERADNLIGTMDGLNEAVLKMVALAMEMAPYGVFALMVGVVATMGLEILLILGFYGLIVVLGLFLHLVLTHSSIIFFYLRTNPLKFFIAIKEAILLGFSTSSSSATLPVSMSVAQKNLGISNEVSSFTLPLGATINMDGTALYQGVAAIFIAQVFGVDLSFTQQLVMILTATLASIGAAGVPGAGMITLAVVLATANIPEVGIALIFGLDRLLDMFRTSLNIVGDLTCTAVMAKAEGETLHVQSGHARGL